MITQPQACLVPDIIRLDSTTRSRGSAYETYSAVLRPPKRYLECQITQLLEAESLASDVTRNQSALSKPAEIRLSGAKPSADTTAVCRAEVPLKTDELDR